MANVKVQVAHGGFVATPTGIAPVASLGSGSPVLAIVGGNAKEAIISEFDGPAESDLVRLLTAIGDVTIPATETVVARSGRIRAETLLADAERGREHRLEVFNPSELPDRRSSFGVGVAQFLDTLDPPVIQLPAPLADDGLAEAVGAILDDAGVVYDRADDDRWVAFVVARGAVGRTPREAKHSLAEQLLRLTAWGWDGEQLVSRTRLDAVDTRRQLVAALVSESIAFEAKWTPGYLPVECRIRRRPDGRWPPFVPLVGALRERGRSVRVATTPAGGLVVGLLISGPLI